MKGLYILIILVLFLAVLGYLVMKPTDSDLRRHYDQIQIGLEILKNQLDELDPLLAELRTKKRSTLMLDKDYNYLKKQERDLQRSLQVARHNIEMLDERYRETTTKALSELKEEKDKLLYRVGAFSNRIKTLHQFVLEGYPLFNRLELLQRQLNQLVSEREKSGKPLTPEKLKDLQSYTNDCRQINDLVQQALKTIHTDLEEGKVISQTAVNQAKQLLPTLEAFLKDLSGSPP